MKSNALNLNSNQIESSTNKYDKSTFLSLIISYQYLTFAGVIFKHNIAFICWLTECRTKINCHKSCLKQTNLFAATFIWLNQLSKFFLWSYLQCLRDVSFDVQCPPVHECIEIFTRPHIWQLYWKSECKTKNRMFVM